MPKIIKVIYEDGVLKPLGEIKLKEHQKIEIYIIEKESVVKLSQGIVKGTSAVIEEVTLNPEYSCLEE